MPRWLSIVDDVTQELAQGDWLGGIVLQMLEPVEERISADELMKVVQNATYKVVD